MEVVKINKYFYFYFYQFTKKKKKTTDFKAEIGDIHLTLHSDIHLTLQFGQTYLSNLTTDIFDSYECRNEPDNTVQHN